MNEKSGIRILVNFSDRNKVKALGCKWNSQEKEWYCPLAISKENLNGLIALQKQRVIGFVKHLCSRSDENYNKGYIDVDYKMGLCNPYTEEEIIKYYGFKPIIYSSYKFGKLQNKKIEKTLYSSKSVCKFCASKKLTSEDIKNIQEEHYFNYEPCHGCKTEYQINKYI